MVAARLQEPDTANGYILDGFPRTLPQASWLDGRLAAQSQSLPVVAVSIHVDYNQLLRRITGRRNCPVCQTIYNVYSNPPQRAGFCDVEGAALVQRADDTEKVFTERMRAYAGTDCARDRALPGAGAFCGSGWRRADCRNCGWNCCCRRAVAQSSAADGRLFVRVGALKAGISGVAVVLKSSDEIEKMRRAGQVVREVLELVREPREAGRDDSRS